MIGRSCVTGAQPCRTLPLNCVGSPKMESGTMGSGDTSGARTAAAGRSGETENGWNGRSLGVDGKSDCTPGYVTGEPAATSTCNSGGHRRRAATLGLPSCFRIVSRP